MCLSKIFSKYSGYVHLFLRVVLGAILLYHGIPKVLNIAGTVSFFGFMGLPLPSLLVYIAVLVEVVGGALLIAGLFTRFAALGVLLQFLVILLLKVPKGVGSLNAYEFDLLIFAVAFALLVEGGGKFGLEKLLLKKEF